MGLKTSPDISIPR